MEPREAGIDSLLRRSMAAPVPSLPPDFDQRLMREVRRSSQPLDRYRRILLTGYGLTSVMRAAFKAMGDGKQVAVLAPTTVLTFQHFETFKRRFEPFPIRIEML